MIDAKSHWEQVYKNRKPDQLSWFQNDPTLSLSMIRRMGLSKTARIIDIGGGASSLVDRLSTEGFVDLSVLDLSSRALAYSKERLGSEAGRIHWIEADVRGPWPAPEGGYDLWHDRAVFHFFTKPEDRAEYWVRLNKVLRIGGSVILAAFAPDGPEQCSGLPVCRYSPQAILAELGCGFELLESESELHRTPWGTEQWFNYFRLGR